MKPQKGLLFLLYIAATLFSLVSISDTVHGQDTTSPPSIQVLKFEYEKECGNPLYESMLWSQVTGKVIEVVNGNTFRISLSDKTQRKVKLVATATPKDADGKIAQKILSDLILGKTVFILVNPSKDKDKNLVGDVRVGGTLVNRKMLELGWARYESPAPYTISGHTACVYKILEEKAQKAKLGLWGDPKQ